VRFPPPVFFRWFAFLAGLLGVGAPVLPAQEVEVTSVRFNNLRAPTGSNGTWLETDVVLLVRPAAGNAGQMVSRVRVAMLLGFELPALAGGERRLEHYRADAECVALEPGRTSVRFYLPPELVKRDQLRGDPKYWGVELSVGGKPVPAGRSAYATSLASAEQRRAFQQRGSAAAAANDGLLQPQYLTPFINEYPRATPSFVRREGR
jgi:hypothetical protein